MSAKTLVLCIDRDDDMGRKAKIKGPIVGREANLKAATALALADPEDSDSNTVFEAIRTYDKMKGDGHKVEVVTLTGDADVGVRSDMKLSKQLDGVLGKTSAKKVVLITDGAQDEHVMPIIQSRAEIAAVKRVVMKQSENLEGMYYVIHDFIENPKMSKVVLGFPALAFLLLAIFDTTGWRIVLGVLGAYLLIKGFQLESRVAAIVNEITTSFEKRRVTFYFYAAAMLVGLVSLKQGYDSIQLARAGNMIETLAAFIGGAVFLVFTGYAIALVGKVVGAARSRREVAKYVTYAAMGAGLSLVAFQASNAILLPEQGYQNLFLSVVFGLLIVAASRALERVV
ncbi:MAG: DUF373 family protein [Candidatus Aenigmatarchaeota archaeon]|nr:MAG: DUF373 family protein [Candidatus Aenigmarchaeota archaeon]